MRRSKEDRQIRLYNFLTASFIILLMIGAIAFKSYSVYVSWKIMANPDVSFWEYFWLTLFFK